MLAVEPSAQLRAKVAENPGVVFEDVAREHNVAPRAVVEALPGEMTRAGSRKTRSKNSRRCARSFAPD